MEIYIHYKNKKREKGVLISSSQSCLIIGINNSIYVVFNSLTSFKRGVLKIPGSNILQFYIQDLDIGNSCDSFIQCTINGSGYPCKDITYITINKKGV